MSSVIQHRLAILLRRWSNRVIPVRRMKLVHHRSVPKKNRKKDTSKMFALFAAPCICTIRSWLHLAPGVAFLCNPFRGCLHMTTPRNAKGFARNFVSAKGSNIPSSSTQMPSALWRGPVCQRRALNEVYYLGWSRETSKRIMFKTS